MLKRRLGQLIKSGRLTICGISKEPMVFGQPGSGPSVTVRISDRFTAWKICMHPDLYLGEAYMDGSLVVEQGSIWDLLDLCGRNLNASQFRRSPGQFHRMGLSVLRFFEQLNSRRASGRNVEHHYDLSDALFQSFLDADRQYSCAYFRTPKLSLEEAQRAKCDHIASKLMLEPGMRVLDIGCGWGGLAIRLAEESGVHVTGISLSKEQIQVARRRAMEAGIGSRVRFELRDYRDVDQRFDRIVSVGMFEHVGVPYYGLFFQTITRLLNDSGVALIHAIGRKSGPGVTGAWVRKYIFPGAYVPALSETLGKVEDTGLWVTDIEVLRLHYAETLRQWRERLLAHASAIRELYDERFCRMWEFYLALSEVGFRYDDLMVFQLQLAKRVDTVPITRDYIYMAEESLRAKVA